MIVLGLLLILLAVGAAAVAVTAPSSIAQVIEISALGLKVSASPLAMFLAGAGSVVLLGLGFALVSGGTRRKARARKELRELRKDQPAPEAATSTRPAEGSSQPDRLPDRAGTEPTETRGGQSSPGTPPEQNFEQNPRAKPDSAPPT